MHDVIANVTEGYSHTHINAICVQHTILYVAVGREQDDGYCSAISSPTGPDCRSICRTSDLPGTARVRIIIYSVYSCIMLIILTLLRTCRVCYRRLSASQGYSITTRRSYETCTRSWWRRRCRYTVYYCPYL